MRLSEISALRCVFRKRPKKRIFEWMRQALTDPKHGAIFVRSAQTFVKSTHEAEALRFCPLIAGFSSARLRRLELPKIISKYLRGCS
jgi:hypothetical protein